MCGTQCKLALIALCVGLAQSWDMAISAGDVIEFYTNGTKTDAVRLESKNLTALAYDEVHNMMLYVDKQIDSETICGYILSFEENICFIKTSGSDIHGLAFDPATQLLFFTDTNEKSINWISLKTITTGSQNGNLLIKMHDRTPTDIAVDSCKGYIYWTNRHNLHNKERMERARFDGSGREVLYERNFHVFSIAIDQQTQKMYYFDGDEQFKFFNNADLKELSEKNTICEFTNEQRVLTVSKDNFYWMTSSGNYKTVWQLPRNAYINKNTKEIGKFYNGGRIGIAANYKMKEQIQGIQGCEALTNLVPNNTDWLFCVHGTKVSGQFICNCLPGYTGERCDVSVCENYCLHGNCSYKDEGLPKCSCNAGYYGERCVTHVCHGYCLNNGTCSLNEKNKPVCQCIGDYNGDRCDVPECRNYCIQGTYSFNGEGHSMCSCNAGYSGERCDVNVCFNYCLNDGDCSLNKENAPVCQCVGKITVTVEV